VNKIKVLVFEMNTLFKKGFFHLFFSNFLIQFMVFGSQMLVAGLLLPEDLGRIKVLQTIVDVASIVAGGGLVVAVLKMVPETQNKTNQKFILQYSLKHAFLFSVGVFIILNILSFLGLLSSDSEINSFFPAFSIVLLASPISLIMVRYFQALDQFKKVSVIQFFTKSLSVGFIIAFTYFYLLKGYFLGVVLGFIITLVYLLYALKGDIFKSSFIDNNIKNKLVKQIINLSKFNFFCQVSDQLRVYAGFFIANYFILDRELFGQYSFALILIQGLGVVSSSVQQFVLPKFSKLSGNKPLFFKELRNYENKYFLIALLLFIGAQVVIPFVVDFLFSGKYNAAMPYFRVLLFGWLIYSAITLKGPAFIGLGRLDMSFKISFNILIIIIPVLIVLCYCFGIWGVIFGYLIQAIISYFYTINFIKKI
tara:strand:- start:10180 stop:11445 length:1266 start_codon:yes stop_codon:yes gene_type:complete